MSWNPPDERPNGDDWSRPPEGVGRGQTPDLEEDAPLTFQPPGAPDVQAEEAAVAPTSALLAGVPPALLAAKTAVEQALRGDTAQRAQRVKGLYATKRG
jgi:hypothetical protein